MKVILKLALICSFIAIGAVVITHLYNQYKKNKQYFITQSKITTSSALPDMYGGLSITDKSIYVSTEDGHVYRLLQNGNTAWSMWMQDYTIYPPFESESTTYITSFDGRVYAIDTETGKEIWRFNIPNYLKADTQPVILDDALYFGSRSGIFYALDALTGNIKWKFETTPIARTNTIPPRPIIHFGFFTVDATAVYINSATDNTIYALNRTSGAVIWKLSNYGYTHKKPVLVSDSLFIQNSEGVYIQLQKDTGVVLQKTKELPLQIKKMDIGITIPEIQGIELDSEYTRNHNDYIYILTKDHNGFIKIQNKNLQKNYQISDFQKKIITEIVYRGIGGGKSESLNIKILQPSNEVLLNTVYKLSIDQDDTIYSNPQKDFQIQAVFTSPQGEKYKVKAFYFDKNTWEVRFTPNQIGNWEWSIDIQTSTTKTGSFRVIVSENPGFMTVRQSSPNVFTVNKKLFYPIGLQDCYLDLNHDGDPFDEWFPGTSENPQKNPQTSTSVSADEYLSVYKSSGFNLWRYGVGNCTRNLWNSLSQNGNRYSLNDSLRVDQLFAALKSHKYHIWMSLFSFQMPVKDIKNKNTQTILEDYLDYIVARYAAYVDVWELANEIHLDERTIDYISKYIHSIDPYRHPVTTNWEKPEDTNIDIISLHWYDTECDTFCNKNLDSQIAKFGKNNKPIVFSELGNKDINWNEYSADRMRVRLWIGYFKNTSPIYWNTSNGFYISDYGASNIYLGPTERGYISVFSKAIYDEQNMTASETKITTDTDGIRIFSRSFNSTDLAYLYRNIYDMHSQSAIIQMNFKAQGEVRWIDPRNGSIVQKNYVSNGEQTLISPPFKTDVILKIVYNI